MSNTILTPIDQITASTGLLWYLRRVSRNAIRKYGLTTSRERLTKTLNDRGAVVNIDRNIAPVNVMLFDRMNSDVLEDAGISNTFSAGSSKKEVPRAYIGWDEDVDEGDFILVNYDSGADTWDERYRVIEKEAHDVSGGTVFYTLYLSKEIDGIVN